MFPDFNRLRVFYYIYKEKSSAAAAAQLHITPSGVSQHLKKLEDELQVKLFSRVKRTLVPTSAGHRMYEIMEGFIRELEEGVVNFERSSEEPSGRLKVGAPAELGRTYMPQIFASFRRSYPLVSLELELGDPNTLFAKVGSGELDFAYIDILPIMLEAPGGLTAYDIQPVLREELILACSGSYYQQKVKSVTYDNLLPLDYIGYKNDISLFSSWFQAQFNSKPPSLNLSLVVDSPGAVVAAIEEGLGLGIIVSHLISDQLSNGFLVEIRRGPGKLENTIACVQLQSKTATLTESTFQNNFRREVENIANIFSPPGFTDGSPAVDR